MRSLLEKLICGEISIEEAQRLIRVNLLQEMEQIAKMDYGREIRKGIPEIILAEGKSPEDVCDIAFKAVINLGHVIISRANKSHVKAIKQAMPQRLQW